MSKRRANSELSLDRRAAKCSRYAAAWQGLLYRATSPEYASSRDLVSGLGAKQHAGRWNPPGEFAVVYGSIDPETAFAESLAQQRYYGLPLHLALPKVVAAIEVRLARVLDIRDKRVRRHLMFDPNKLAVADWRSDLAAGKKPASHELGRSLHRAGWEGVLVPSGARRGAANMIVFPANLAAGSQLRGLGTDFVRPT